MMLVILEAPIVQCKVAQAGESCGYYAMSPDKAWKIGFFG